MDQELIAYFDERFRETSRQIQDLREETVQQFTSFRAEVDQRFEQVDRRFGQVGQRLDQLQETVHGTQILVEDLRGKIELVAEGVVGVNERLDAALEKTAGDIQEVRSVFTAHNKNLNGRIQVVEDLTVLHTRQITALRRRSKKTQSSLS